MSPGGNGKCSGLKIRGTSKESQRAKAETRSVCVVDREGAWVEKNRNKTKRKGHSTLIYLHGSKEETRELMETRACDLLRSI
jgi:hypothetical protein